MAPSENEIDTPGLHYDVHTMDLSEYSGNLKQFSNAADYEVAYKLMFI